MNDDEVRVLLMVLGKSRVTPMHADQQSDDLFARDFRPDFSLFDNTRARLYEGELTGSEPDLKSDEEAQGPLQLPASAQFLRRVEENKFDLTYSQRKCLASMTAHLTRWYSNAPADALSLDPVAHTFRFLASFLGFVFLGTVPETKLLSCNTLLYRWKPNLARFVNESFGKDFVAKRKELPSHQEILGAPEVVRVFKTARQLCPDTDSVVAARAMFTVDLNRLLLVLGGKRLFCTSSQGSIANAPLDKDALL
jgi:hypothetical protein